MIYIFTALYAEAQPLIQRFQLKKEKTRSPFDTFYNEDKKLRLILTGVGSIASASAVSYICSCYPLREEDFLINFGSCAGNALEEVFLCHKLTERATGKTFYPDILYKHPFQEAELITESKVLEQGLDSSKLLHDMEAAAIYQAGNYFIAPHQMFFLKVVSDAGQGNQVEKQQLQQLIDKHMDAIEGFIKELQEISIIENEKRQIFSQEEEKKIKQFCEDLHCTQTMEASVVQCARYGKLSGIPYEDIIEKMYREEELPCKDKREGKYYFEEFRKQIL